MSASDGAAQLALLDLPAPEAEDAADERDPRREAERWREANPEGWDLLVSWAKNDLRAGRHCSMKYYGERLRHTARTTRVDGCPYLINNTAFSGLVRMLVDDWPELEGAFETRRSRADRT